MTNILDALHKLDESLGLLESACAKQERAAAARKDAAMSSQHDLFGNTHNIQHFDPLLIAKKLDVAIERVESVLREA